MLVDKELDHLEKEQLKTPPGLVPNYRLAFSTVEPGGTITLDVEEFQYTYKCNLCGNEWSEKRTEKHIEKDTYGDQE